MKSFLLTLLSFCCFQIGFTQEDEWQSIEDMPIGKHHPVTFGLNGFGYAATGTAFNNTWTNDVYKYDPIADEWETIDDFPGAARSFAIGTTYKGKGYLGFGATSNQYLRDIWEFDPETESWELLTTCACPGRRHPAFVIEDDKIFVGMGDNLSGNLRDWWVYDMIEDTWERQDDLPGLVRHHPFQFTADGEVFAGFGHGGNGIYRDWYHFDKTTFEWTEMELFPGEERVAGTQFHHRDFGYVLSGDGSNHSFMLSGEFWQYDPEDDSWEELTPHPGISLWAPGSFVLEDTVYFLGGQNRINNTIVNKVWRFELPTPTPPDTSTSVNEISDGATMNIFPNPANRYVEFSGNFEYEFVELYNITGQRVLRLSDSKKTIDVNHLAPGVYSVKFIGEKELSQKLVIE